MKEPQKMPFEAIWEAYQSTKEYAHHVFFAKIGLIQVMGIEPHILRHLMKKDTPYLVEEYRCGLVARGWVRACFNLRECRVESGTLVFMTPGSIVEFREQSDDFQLFGVGMPQDLFNVAHEGQVPPLFKGTMRDGQLAVTEAEQVQMVCLYRALWETIHSPVAGRETAYRLIAAVTWQFNELFVRHSLAQGDKPGAAQSLFDRFITLVNAHSREHRQLDFYADKLCVTERYLGTVVRQTSGVTAKEWVDRSVVVHAKVMLRHSSRQVAQIADALHFPNPSFFCKYFKRLAGCTPEEYRRRAEK